MAKFHTTGGLVGTIENLIKDAQEKLIIVSPYLQINPLLIPRLKDASARNVAITFVYRSDDKTTKIEMDRLKEIKGLTMYVNKHLHAKCFMNEKRALITSMNLYDYSQQNNREIGISLNAAEDKDLYKDTLQEMESIISHSLLLTKLKEAEKKEHKSVLFKSAKQTNISTDEGHCIRCAKTIQYNPKVPYCKDCYNTWAQFGNSNYPENVCHTCNKPINTTMDNPQCYYCYRKLDARKAAW